MICVKLSSVFLLFFRQTSSCTFLVLASSSAALTPAKHQRDAPESLGLWLCSLDSSCWVGQLFPTSQPFLGLLVSPRRLALCSRLFDAQTVLFGQSHTVASCVNSDVEHQSPAPPPTPPPLRSESLRVFWLYSFLPVFSFLGHLLTVGSIADLGKWSHFALNCCLPLIVYRQAGQMIAVSSLPWGASLFWFSTAGC